ncbi:hypothetical protein F7725_010245 [Dissostichus mawsoni]|uniref:PH domain-containing protein n=1 Tax=Dissostichus mawsoni TaxID=36200 RepID=A0A7J5XPH0_DISMA|nr:hypothetical protein F7725_010245 [Dissostichus mawsoni]
MSSRSLSSISHLNHLRGSDGSEGSEELKDHHSLPNMILICRNQKQAAEGHFCSQVGVQRRSRQKVIIVTIICVLLVFLAFTSLMGREDHTAQDYDADGSLLSKAMWLFGRLLFWTLWLLLRLLQMLLLLIESLLSFIFFAWSPLCRCASFLLVVHKRRATITDLPLYYSGHLRKKLTKEKDFKKYYGELRGATLFLYKDDTHDTYTEKLDLGQLKSMQLHSPYQKKTPTIFTLTLKTEEVQLQMDNSDTGEEWRGYILTVVKKEIPSKLQLLPGQMLQLQEALDQERRRNPTTQRPELPPRPLFLRTPPPSNPPQHLPPPLSAPLPPPPPHRPKTRLRTALRFLQAEHMLKVNPECGTIILRPSTLANNYALTLRQQTSSGPILKNFRVTSTNVGFVIELDTAVTVSSLNEVLKYFLEKTEYRLHPFVASQPYDTRIGEWNSAVRRLQHVSCPKCVSISSAILKTVPKAQVAPMLRSETKEELPPPPTNQDEGDYVMPDDHDPKLKPVQMDGELEAVLKLQRKNLYTETEEVNTYENQSSEKPPSAAVQWSGNS